MSAKELNLKVKNVYVFTTPALAAAVPGAIILMNAGNIVPVPAGSATAAQIAGAFAYSNQYKIVPLALAGAVAGGGPYFVSAIVPGVSATFASVEAADTSTLQVTMTTYECL